MVPRAVLVTRPTWYRQLLMAHGTHGQARFFLGQRDQAIEPLVVADQRQVDAVRAVAHAIPTDWRQARVTRSDLDRFLFEPEDVVLAVGQDGLVANVARFLSGQVVIGFNPNAEENDGILVPHAPDHAKSLLKRAAAGEGIRNRTMVQATLDDGTTLRALNEVFIGQPSHQSARYVLNANGQSERHSSSGVLVSSGTGCTGWARSVCRERANHPDVPTPWERAAMFLVREAFPSRSTGCTLTSGLLAADASIHLRSEMDDGVIFADGIEADRLHFGWGRQVTVSCAPKPLHLLEAA
jgi:hypothetical protein